jgi:hypothetical protein
MISTLLTTVLALGSGIPETGTILYLKHSNSVVQQVTGSNLSHVAMVIQIADQPWVYEATPAEVRRVAFARYLQEISLLNQSRGTKIQVFAMRPQVALSTNQIQTIRAYMDVQLGRRYSVAAYVRGRNGDGIHCAELLATALDRAGVRDYKERHRLSPVGFVNQAQSVYRKPARLDLPEVQPDTDWCDQQWDWWLGMIAWCQWAWDEAWSFSW